MDAEDGVIWVYGSGEDSVMAFTDFGIENLIELIKNPQRRSNASEALTRQDQTPCGLRRMLTRQLALEPSLQIL